VSTYVDVRREGPIATLLLNRPDKLNSLTDHVLREFMARIGDLESDGTTRVVVLGGNGRSFCAGFDLTWRKNGELSPDEWREHARLAIDAYKMIWESPLPFVAKVHGHCLGGGCELAVVCDVTIAAQSAVFGEPEVRFGTGPLFNILPLAAGFKNAMYLLLTGDNVGAEEAARLGLVSRVVPDHELEAKTYAVAQRVAMSPPVSVKMFKRAVWRVFEVAGFPTTVDATGEMFAFVQLETADSRREFRTIAKESGFSTAYKWLESEQRKALER
jgi:enoyl-CoA hydratase/carnithine racemase